VFDFHFLFAVGLPFAFDLLSPIVIATVILCKFGSYGHCLLFVQ